MALPRGDSRSARVSLEREGRGTHELQQDQVTVENLRRLFKVSCMHAWLYGYIFIAASRCRDRKLNV